MRRINFYKNHFTDFYFEHTEKVQKKVDYVLDLIRTVDRVPERFLKHLTSQKRIKNNRNINSFEQLLEVKYEKKGTPLREKFEEESKAFMIGELFKEERIRANMTQEQLAQKTETQKSYISRYRTRKKRYPTLHVI